MQGFARTEEMQPFITEEIKHILKSVPVWRFCVHGSGVCPIHQNYEKMSGGKKKFIGRMMRYMGCIWNFWKRQEKQI